MTTSVASQTMDIARFASEVDRNGWATIEQVVDDATLNEIERDIAPFIEATPARGGVRKLLDTCSAVRRLVQARRLLLAGKYGIDVAITTSTGAFGRSAGNIDLPLSAPTTAR